MVVANADEPLVVWAALAREAGHLGGYRRRPGRRIPRCAPNATAVSSAFSQTRISGLGGDWYCTSCDLAQPKGDYRVESGTIVDRTQQVWDPQLSVPGVFNVSNAACALAAAELMGVDPRDCPARNAYGHLAGWAFRHRARLGTTTARLLLAKNPAGWAEALPLAQTQTVVLAIDSAAADGRDVSWLWDVDYERLAGRTGDRDRAPSAGPGRTPPVRRGRVSLHSRSCRCARGSLRTRRCDRHIHPVSAAAQDGEGLMNDRGPGQRVEVVLIYQSLLGLYGDRGNATVLVKRLAWRGYDPVLTFVEPGRPLPDTGRVYLLGGGEDAAQVSAVRALKADGGLHRAVDRGAALLAVCAGYQIVGNSFTVGYQNEVISGLGLLDVTTTRGPVRAVGEIISRWDGRDGDDQWLTGFENHGGYTTLGPDAKPLATVEIGVGNCNDGTEGAVAGTVIGTYPHGPVLARNPALADHLLELALGHELEPLTHPEINKLRRQRLARVRRLYARNR